MIVKMVKMDFLQRARGNCMVGVTCAAISVTVGRL